MRKKSEKHQIFRKLAADSSADTSADASPRINIRLHQQTRVGGRGVSAFADHAIAGVWGVQIYGKVSDLILERSLVYILIGF